MIIHYLCTCFAPGPDRALEVPDRDPTDDLMEWMDILTFRISLDHAAKSPHCRSNKMTHVKIPVPHPSLGIGISPPTIQ